MFEYRSRHDIIIVGSGKIRTFGGTLPNQNTHVVHTRKVPSNDFDYLLLSCLLVMVKQSQASYISRNVD